MVGGSITVKAAAERLSVSTQRLRQLIGAGDILAERHGHVWAVSPASVDDYVRRRRPTAGRSLSLRMAWAAMLSDFGTAFDDPVIEYFALRRTERTRLALLSERDPNEWRWLVKRRAGVQRLNTFDAYLDCVAAMPDVIRTGVSAINEHGVDPAVHQRTLDLYATAGTTHRIRTSMRLQPSSTGNLTLRTLPTLEPLLLILDEQVMPLSVVGVDLLDDSDPRTARAGADVIQSVRDGS
jgi:hypothetical protein